MNRSRPPSANRDAGTRRAVQAAVARKKRLATAQPVVFPEDAREPAAAPLATITAETSSPLSFQSGLRQYNPPTLRQPPQPWSWPGVQDTPLPLRATETGAAGDVNIAAAVLLAAEEVKAEARETVSAEVVPAGQRPAIPDPKDVLKAAPLTIRPTIYPTPPGDAVTVDDPVSIDIQSAEFRDFVAKLDGFIVAVRQSNEIAREVGDKLIAEVKAGREYIAGPRPSRKVLDLLLVNPLVWAALGFAGTFLGETAKLAFKAFLKLISPDVDIPPLSAPP